MFRLTLVELEENSALCHIYDQRERSLGASIQLLAIAPIVHLDLSISSILLLSHKLDRSASKDARRGTRASMSSLHSHFELGA